MCYCLLIDPLRSFTLSKRWSVHCLRNDLCLGFSSEIRFRTLSTVVRNLLLLTLLIVFAPSPGYAQTIANQEQATGIDAQLQNAIDNLANIQQSIESKRKTIREFREQLKKLQDTSEKQELEQKIERVRNEIINLQFAFEHIALGGVNLSSLTEQPEQQVNWREELEQISRPLISTLKEVTAKPRQIDSLRRDIERQENQLEIIDKALDSIRRFKKQALPAVAADPVNQLLIDWEQRRDDTQRLLDITHFKLNSLITDSVAWHESAREAIKEFLQGRGLTLLLATIIGLAIWLVFKALLGLYWRWLYRTRNDIGVTRAPLVIYTYRLVTAVVIVLAILMVFYVRGDVLLLTLAVIALAGAALGLRQTLPRYAAELRLLLGIGPVREEERLVLDGIPFMVESLGVYSVLRNPALEGVLRLPLHDMNALASRPVAEQPWFPCRPSGRYRSTPIGEPDATGRVRRRAFSRGVRPG